MCQDLSGPTRSNKPPNLILTTPRPYGEEIALSPLSNASRKRKISSYRMMTVETQQSSPRTQQPQPQSQAQILSRQPYQQPNSTPDQHVSPSVQSSPAVTNRQPHPFQTPIESTYGYSAPLSGKSSSMSSRRTSRFDPMGRTDEDADDEGYGELGYRHPSRKLNDEGHRLSNGPSPSTFSLPGIKSLFGVASDNPSTPSSSSLYASPSLPSLVPNSPLSSPSTARTSRYSSLGSTMSSASDMQHPPNGWWAPEFSELNANRARSMSTTSPIPLSGNRSNSYPFAQPSVDAHSDKRRRSDDPPTSRDTEEGSRLRWVAQNRNASFPNALTNSGSSSTHGLRSLLHPPQASSASMSKSISGVSQSSALSSPLTPFAEHQRTPEEFPFEKRAATPSRTGSIGGQLAQSFADLTASERERERRSPLGPQSPRHTEMLPPGLPPDRRQSSPHASALADPMSRTLPSPHPLSRPPSTNPSPAPLPLETESLHRQSLTRPSTPDGPERPTLRRSSLTEIIMAKSGDDVAMATGKFQPQPLHRHSAHAIQTVPQASDKISSTELQRRSSTPLPTISGWQPSRGPSTDGPDLAHGNTISLDSDGEGVGALPSIRAKKRGFEGQKPLGDVDMDGDPGMRGMEVLAESARRVSESNEDKDELNGESGGSLVGPKYTCAFCAKTFSRPSSLRIHTYSHTGERPFVCKEPSCGRRFSVQSNLKRHAKVHQMGGTPGGPNDQRRPSAIGYSHQESLPPTPHHLGHGYYRPAQSPSGQPVYGQYYRTDPGHRIHPQPPREEEWSGEEDELEEDELIDELDERD